MPGAASAEGMKFVHDSDPDGYTIVQNGSQMLTLPYFYTKEEIGWTLEDFEPIAVQQIIVYMLVVPKDSPFNTLTDFIEYARANPGKLNHGVVGWGGDSHVAFKALELEADFKATVVPFDSGADQVANIAGGHIDAAVATFGTMLPLAQSGDAKVLAVGAEERNPALPDTPTALEQGVNWVFPNWRGWLAPPGTPKERVEYIAGIIEQALADEALQNTIRKGGEVPRYIGLDDFKEYLTRVDKILRPAIDAIQAEQQ
jgi:tripartite-type tricarboxylate transporter receptor subunit TctC